jgi:hypothetical protein
MQRAVAWGDTFRNLSHPKKNKVQKSSRRYRRIHTFVTGLAGGLR